MKVKVVGEMASFVCELQETQTIQDLYQIIKEHYGKEMYLFKRSPRIFIESSERPLSDVFNDLECIYAENSLEIKGPEEIFVDTAPNKNIRFEIHEVPSDNSCLFHSLSYLLSSKTSTELRQLVADTILQTPDKFVPFLEKDPGAYAKWITNPDIWGGATEITIISNIYQTKISVIDRNLQVIEFGDNYKDVIYLQYSGSHYNAVVAKDRSGHILKKFVQGDVASLEAAKTAVSESFRKEKQ
ncbi:ubiquitin thioesterase OTU1 [Nematocida sp. AWRm80]|nr:ubiquitin thioesterase OTU1 [Nematocida sp. AWRm80]